MLGHFKEFPELESATLTRLLLSLSSEGQDGSRNPRTET